MRLRFLTGQAQRVTHISAQRSMRNSSPHQGRQMHQHHHCPLKLPPTAPHPLPNSTTPFFTHSRTHLLFTPATLAFPALESPCPRDTALPSANVWQPHSSSLRPPPPVPHLVLQVFDFIHEALDLGFVVLNLLLLACFAMRKGGGRRSTIAPRPSKPHSTHNDNLDTSNSYSTGVGCMSAYLQSGHPPTPSP
jgi:hypothetical protein